MKCDISVLMFSGFATEGHNFGVSCSRLSNDETLSLPFPPLFLSLHKSFSDHCLPNFKDKGYHIINKRSCDENRSYVCKTETFDSYFFTLRTGQTRLHHIASQKAVRVDEGTNTVSWTADVNPSLFEFIPLAQYKEQQRLKLQWSQRRRSRSSLCYIDDPAGLAVPSPQNSPANFSRQFDHHETHNESEQIDNDYNDSFYAPNTTPRDEVRCGARFASDECVITTLHEMEASSETRGGGGGGGRQIATARRPSTQRITVQQAPVTARPHYNLDVNDSDDEEDGDMECPV
eukprot:Selendium_serpulae@DN6115_c2_g3_i2.p1